MKLLCLFLCRLTFLTLLQAEPVLSDETATATGKFTLEGASRVALANNPAIKEAWLKWSAMKDRIPQEGAWDDLKVSVSSRFARFVLISPNGFTDQTLSFEQMIPVSGKNRSRARIATAEAMATYEEVRRQQLDVLARTRASYFGLANAYAQIELNRQNLVSLKQIAEISRSKYEVGNQSAADVFVAEIEASKLLETRRDLERTLAAEQSRLNVLMNRDAFASLGEPVETVIRPLTYSIDDLRQLTIAHRPEIARTRATVQAEKAKLELAHREWIPDPAITIQGQRYNNATQVVSELNTGVSFNIPWSNYRKYSAGVREAGHTLGAAQQALEGLQREALGLLRDVWQKVETAHHHVELIDDKLVPQAKQAFAAHQLAYESGQAGFLDWITAQRNVRDLLSMQRQSQADYQTALAELEAVVGADLQLFPKSLPPPQPQSK